MIEIGPGRIVNVGQIFNPDLMRAAGEQLLASYEALKSRGTPHLPLFRHHVRENCQEYGRVSLSDDIYRQVMAAHAALFERISVNVDTVRDKFDLEWDQALDVLIQDELFPRLGWHYDPERDIRIATNVGHEATSIFFANMSDAPGISRDFARSIPPRKYRKVPLMPGQSYIINGIADFNHLSPHATPLQLGRIILTLAIETRSALTGEIATRYETDGGLTVRVGLSV